MSGDLPPPGSVTWPVIWQPAPWQPEDSPKASILLSDALGNVWLSDGGKSFEQLASAEERMMDHVADDQGLDIDALMAHPNALPRRFLEAFNRVDFDPLASESPAGTAQGGHDADDQ